MLDLLEQLQTVATSKQPIDPIWLRYAITEIERLRTENRRLAHLLMSPLVYVNERIITEVDQILEPYIGGQT